jgi:hypothetical protein
MTDEKKIFCANCGNEIQRPTNGETGVCSNCQIQYIISFNGTIVFGHTPEIYCNPYDYYYPYGYYYHRPEYKRTMEPDNTQYISSILSRLSTLENEMKELKNKK